MKFPSFANPLRRHAVSLSAVTVLASAVLLPTFNAHAGVADRLFDFTDAYYRQNGVNPAAIAGRRQPVLPNATTDAPPHDYQNNTRALLTLPAYGGSGEVEFFTVIGGSSSTLFTNDAAGSRARQIAEFYKEYIFPKKGTDPVGLANVRQGFMLDTRNGYFSNDKLGLWLHVWVSYTDKAFNTKDGKKALADLASKNGLDLDGTPIIDNASDVENLASKGFVALTTRPLTDSLRYSICPTIKDPRNGGIAADQFLRFVLKADGTPLEPEFVAQFQSLRTTGEEAK
jgi:hypothetical protein